MKTENESIRNIINSIFMFEVDSKNLGYKEIDRYNRKYFWKYLYVERNRETLDFKEFIKVDSPLLFVTGHVGSGKSTFIRHKFEKLKICDGIIIDLKGKEREFDSCKDFTSIYELSKKIIKDAFYKSLVNNFKLNLYLNEDMTRKYDYDIDNDILDIDNEMWKSPTLIQKARFYLAQKALFYIQESEYLDNIKENNYLFATDDSLYEEKIIEILDENPQYINNIIKNLEWYELVVLARCVFKNTLPFFIVFDNFDIVPLKNVKNHFLECLISISHILNRNIEVPFVSMDFGNTKLVFCIRDENISRFSQHSKAAFHDTQIILSNDGHLVADSNKIKRFPIDDNLCYNAIVNRMEAVAKTIESLDLVEEEIKFFENFKLIINNFWIDNSAKILKDGIGYINIKDFSNDSLRLMFSYIVISSFNVIDRLSSLDLLDKLESDDFPYQLVKGLIIKYLWGHNGTHKIFNEFMDETKLELEKNACSMHRLTLSYLYNQKHTKVTTAKYISRFQTLFDLKESELKQILFNLFNSPFKESELISIYQNDMIDDYNCISNSDESEIKLNPKGAVFLLKIIIHPDFYGMITEHDHQLNNLVMLELTPQQLLKYFKSICHFIKELVEAHILIFDSMHKYFPDFNSYKKEFSPRKDAFHLERVCSSHLAHLKTYVINEIRKNNIKMTNIEDEKISEHVNAFNKNHPISHLWNDIYPRLKYELPMKLKNIREMT